MSHLTSITLSQITSTSSQLIKCPNSSQWQYAHSHQWQCPNSNQWQGLDLTQVPEFRSTIVRTKKVFPHPKFVSEWYSDYFLSGHYLLRVWPKNHSDGMTPSPSAAPKPQNYSNSFLPRLAKIMSQTITWGLYLIRFNSLLPSQKGHHCATVCLSKKSNFVVFLDVLGSIRQD